MRFTYNKAKTRRTYIRLNPGWTYSILRQELQAHNYKWVWTDVKSAEDDIWWKYRGYKAACRAAREWREEKI